MRRAMRSRHLEERVAAGREAGLPHELALRARSAPASPAMHPGARPQLKGDVVGAVGMRTPWPRPPIELCARDWCHWDERAVDPTAD